MSIFFVIIGFILLVVGGDFLVKAAISLSFKLKISKMVIGMTVVSFATSVPELLVSLQAALDGSPAIAINNIIGSNIANIGLVLGITAIIGPIAVQKDFYKFNWPVMMFFSVVLYYFLINDAVLTQIEGVLLLAGLAIFLFVLIRNARKEELVIEDIDDALAEIERCVTEHQLKLLCLPTHFLNAKNEWTSIADKSSKPENTHKVILIRPIYYSYRGISYTKNLTYDPNSDSLLDINRQ